MTDEVKIEETDKEVRVSIKTPSYESQIDKLIKAMEERDAE